MRSECLSCNARANPFILALLVIAASSVYFGVRIATAKVPMQWGIDGNPTWYAPRTIGLWSMLGFTLIIGGGLLAMMRFVESEKVAGLSYSLIFLSVTAAITQIWHLNAVSKWAARQ